MKFFTSTLSIVALFATGSVCAKVITQKTTTTTRGKAPVATKGKIPAARGRQAEQPKVTTETSTSVLSGTYPELLAQIRKMPPAKVITGNNLNPDFVKLILGNTDLSRTEAEALLQAGVNIHTTWSGKPEQDEEKLQSLTMQVAQMAQQVEEDEYMDMPDLFELEQTKTAKKLPAIPGKKTPQAPIKTPKKLPTTPGKKTPAAPDFYNTENNLLDTYSLVARVTQEMENTTKSTQQIIDMLQKELGGKMRYEWTNRGITNTVSLSKEVNRQIVAAVNSVASEKNPFNTFNNDALPVTTKFEQPAQDPLAALEQMQQKMDIEEAQQKDAEGKLNNDIWEKINTQITKRTTNATPQAEEKGAEQPIAQDQFTDANE